MKNKWILLKYMGHSIRFNEKKKCKTVFLKTFMAQRSWKKYKKAKTLYWNEWKSLLNYEK